MNTYTFCAVAAYAFIVGALWGAITTARHFERRILKPSLKERLDYLNFIKRTLYKDP